MYADHNLVAAAVVMIVTRQRIHRLARGATACRHWGKKNQEDEQPPPPASRQHQQHQEAAYQLSSHMLSEQTFFRHLGVFGHSCPAMDKDYILLRTKVKKRKVIFNSSIQWTRLDQDKERKLPSFFF